MRVLILLLFAFNASAQVKNFLQLGVSANGYKGDLSSAYQKWGGAFHAGFKTNEKKRINFHFNLGIGNVTGQNAAYQYFLEDGTAATPNNYFKTKWISGTVDVQVNLYKSKNLIVYLSQGIGFLNYNVLDDNNKSFSQNVGTRDLNEVYSTTTVMLPTNAGLIYLFNNGYGAGFQAGFYNPQTDYIDNISNWGTADKKDNILVYKFSFYVPLGFSQQKQVADKATPPLVINEVLDSDEDGIDNSIDDCPHEKGPVSNSGCPLPLDSDGDSIIDDEDRCPQVKGSKGNNGCPDTLADSDFDGVPDEEDACPELVGTLSNRGCPVIKEEVEVIEKVKETLVFETGKAIILPISYPALNDFAEQLKKNREAIILIEGHTDNVGKDSENEKLSLERTEAVKNYLVEKGIESDRIETKGLGATSPIAPNDTEEGRAQNRRVEIFMIYGN